MTLKRAVTATKLDYLLRVLNALACLAAGIAVLRDPRTYPGYVVLGIVVVQIVSALTVTSRIRASQTLGRWDERYYVMSSMQEAHRRDLSPEDWIVGYRERVLAECIAEGMAADDGQEKTPGQPEG